jgi:hypothetical protein
MMNATNNTEKQTMGKIRCDLHDGGGTFSETFDKIEGWQDSIRCWVKQMKARFSISESASLSMWYAKNGTTYSFIKTMEL